MRCLCNPISITSRCLGEKARDYANRAFEQSLALREQYPDAVCTETHDGKGRNWHVRGELVAYVAYPE